MNDLDLRALDVETLFVLNDQGRALHDNAPDRSPAPRMYLAGCESGNVVRIRHDVATETARTIEALVADEPPLHGPDSVPAHLGEYLRLLAVGEVGAARHGLSWVFPDRLNYPHQVELIGSDSPEGSRLLAQLDEEGMPDSLAGLGFVDPGEFWAPWCVARHEDEIASIAFAARLGPLAAATGVATVPARRGHGFAAAATAGWADLPSLRGHVLFYGTDRANRSSRRVAERLGLRFLGASFSIA